MSLESLREAVLTLLDESFEGPPDHQGSWYTDHGRTAGLLRTLEAFDHQAASTPPGPGRATAAAHAEHLRYSLELANRALRGEDPYSSADWKASWAKQTVDAGAWASLREAIRAEYRNLRAAVADSSAWAEQQEALTGVLAVIAHTAYHLGATRQILRLVTH